MRVPPVEIQDTSGYPDQALRQFRITYYTKELNKLYKVNKKVLTDLVQRNINIFKRFGDHGLISKNEPEYLT